MIFIKFAVVSALAISCSCDVFKTVLENGEILEQGQCLTSPNKIYLACVDSTGHLVVNKRCGGELVWKSPNEPDPSGPYTLQMQTDNNLCLKGGHWCADSHGKGTGQARLELRDDGNLVVEGFVPIWSYKTGLITLPNGRHLGVNECLTSLNEKYKGCLQDDGNFCVGIWCALSDSMDRSNNYTFHMQEDNNLCIKDSVWCLYSQNRGTALAYLHLQDDGNLVVGSVTWSATTGFAGKKME